MSTVAAPRMKMQSPDGGDMNTPAINDVVGMSAPQLACEARGRGAPQGYRVAKPADDDEASIHNATPFASAVMPASARSSLRSDAGPTMVWTNVNGMSTYDEPEAPTKPSRSTTSRGATAVVVMQNAPTPLTG